MAGAALLHFRDPHVPGSYGFCPFYELTGWWCPGCGGMRAMHDLTDGRVLDTIHSNIFLLPLVIGFAVWWGDWVLRRWRGLPARRPVLRAGWATWAVVAAMIGYTVLRNTPWGTWLAPV